MGEDRGHIMLGYLLVFLLFVLGWLCGVCSFACGVLIAGRPLLEKYLPMICW